MAGDNGKQKRVVIKKEQPSVRIYVDSAGHMHVDGNMKRNVSLAMLCDAAALLSRQEMQEEEKPKGRIIMPNMGITGV